MQNANIANSISIMLRSKLLPRRLPRAGVESSSGVGASSVMLSMKNILESSNNAQLWPEAALDEEDEEEDDAELE